MQHSEKATESMKNYCLQQYGENAYVTSVGAAQIVIMGSGVPAGFVRVTWPPDAETALPDGTGDAEESGDPEGAAEQEEPDTGTKKGKKKNGR